MESTMDQRSDGNSRSASRTIATMSASVHARCLELERVLGMQTPGKLLSPDELGIDPRAFECGRLAALREVADEIQRAQAAPVSGRLRYLPADDIEHETAEFVLTERAAQLVGRSTSTITKWSMAGRSPCGSAIPYTDTRDRRTVLWKVSELRDFLGLGQAGMPANAGIVPRVPRKRAEKIPSAGGTAG